MAQILCPEITLSDAACHRLIEQRYPLCGVSFFGTTFPAPMVLPARGPGKRAALKRRAASHVLLASYQEPGQADRFAPCQPH